jgi:hypothetical protein
VISMEGTMRVTRQWLADFETVMKHMDLDAWDIDECKAEAREYPAWALEYYPRAAAIIAADSHARAFRGVSR